MVEVNRVVAENFKCKVKPNISCHHHKIMLAGRCYRCIPKTKSLERRMVNELSGFCVFFVNYFDSSLKKLPDVFSFYAGKVCKIANLAEDMRRRHQWLSESFDKDFQNNKFALREILGPLERFDSLRINSTNKQKN